MRCAKKAYTDIKAARNAIKVIDQTPNMGKKPIRAYLCPECNKYHITSKQKTGYGKQ